VVNLLSGFGVTADRADLGILEDRAIELRRLFGFGIEPRGKA
jgi:hypothetical protein